MTISSNTVILKFRWILGTDKRRILSGQTVHTASSCGSPLFRVSFVATDQRASTKTPYMEGLSCHNNSPLIGRKIPAKFENDRILRNGHRINITQPNLMI